MRAMRVIVTRSGGLAGVRRQAVVDTAALSKRDAETLRKLVHVAVLDEPSATSRTPDAFGYEIVVDDERGDTKRYRTDDGSLSGEARALVEWVLKHR